MKKEKILILSCLTALVIMLILAWPLAPLTRFSLDRSGTDRVMTLNYVIHSPREKITLNLYEAEKYEPAIIVQQLIGNLVYYSNHGRYEPRLAKSWRRVNSTTWEFEIRDGLMCENGEIINASAFKKSITRSIKHLAQHSSVPILEHLVGYKSFVKGEKEYLEGLVVNENKLLFVFKNPIRSGLVQILSFAQFGYICDDNFKKDLSWKNNEKFISSGPYRVRHIEIGKEYLLEKNPNWKMPYSKNAPDQVYFSHVLEDKSLFTATIFDNNKSKVEMPSFLSKYKLIPDYLNAIILGNLDKGYFSNIQNRKLISEQIRKYSTKVELPKGNHTKSQTFYPSQDLERIEQENNSAEFENLGDNIIIEGREPAVDDDSPRGFAWKILKITLDENKLSYKFAGNEATFKEITNPNYDIRIRSSSIGGGVEAWGINIIFCSEMGIKFPDPSGNVCHALVDYELDKISFEEFSSKFLTSVREDFAIIPISHFGGELYFSDNIDRASVSPTINVIKFDQLDILP